MRTARAEATLTLAPEAARRLWTDTRRWASFVEGFGHTLEVSGDWPSEGSKVVWESGVAGRGRVTEKVVESGADRIATQLFEDALSGTQTVTFAEDAEGSRVELRLDYELSKYGPLRGLADVIFIRRALRDSLARTLRRFATEAAEESAL